jgi:hypothetical protein
MKHSVFLFFAIVLLICSLLYSVFFHKPTSDNNYLLCTKILVFKNSIELAISNANKSNDLMVRKIEQFVEKSPQNKNVLEDAYHLKKLSREMIDEIEACKEEIIKVTGGKDDKGNYIGLQDEEKTKHLLVGDPLIGKKGLAYILQNRLNGFVNELNNITGTKFQPLAQDGKDDPFFKDFPEYNGKDFAQLNFSHTPMIVALALLSDKQFKITAYTEYKLTMLVFRLEHTNK